jgi:NAD(P)-dependent dehydrogenase (short-subunit alcohol dehydrogenase family)
MLDCGSWHHRGIAKEYSMKRRVIITGAAGGIGRACARLFGATQDLILTDVVAQRLHGFAETLREEGYSVAGAHAGDLGSETLLSALSRDLVDNAPFTLIHTAGVSPSLAEWQSILTVNLVTTEKLLRSLETSLIPGSVAVLIASTAGHMMPAIADVQAILDEPLAADLLDRISPLIQAMAAQAGPAGAKGISYSLSKQAVLRICERRAVPWGRQGARIVTISPGLILTPMGRKELAETAGAAEMRDAAPAGRSGTAMDIALTAQFLASDNASFITGSDIKVDGGSVAAIRGRGA